MIVSNVVWTPPALQLLRMLRIPRATPTRYRDVRGIGYCNIHDVKYIQYVTLEVRTIDCLLKARDPIRYQFTLTQENAHKKSVEKHREYCTATAVTTTRQCARASSERGGGSEAVAARRCRWQREAVAGRGGAARGGGREGR